MLNTAGLTDAAPKATRHDWIGLAVIALPCMLYSMDLTVLNLAVPALTADLNPTAAQLLWIIDIYGFMVAGFLIIMGTLGDRIGRRKLLMIGAGAFGAASLLAAFSTSAEMLIFSRALLGLAGATLAPSTLSLISNMFRDPEERTFAIGMWISSFSVGAIIGPVIGGLLIQYFWWGSVFIAGVPVMALLLILGPRLLPEYRDVNAGQIDITSALLSLAAVLTFIYGLKTAAASGMNWHAAGFMIAGLGLAAIFVRRQMHLAEPLIDMRLFKSRTFSVALGVNFLGVFFMFGAYVLIAQYFQLVAGLTPLQAGLCSLPSAIVFTAVSMLTPAMTRRVSTPNLMAAGMLVSAIGFFTLAQATSLTTVVLASVVFFAGFTPVVTLTTDVIVGTAPPEKAGVAAGMSETASEFGGALGIAVLGSLSTAIYRLNMTLAMPDSLSPDAAAAAGATIAGAVQAANPLPAETAEPLLTAARAAFSAGLQLTAVIAALAMLLAAIATFKLLQNVKHNDEGEAAVTL